MSRRGFRQPIQHKKQTHMKKIFLMTGLSLVMIIFSMNTKGSAPQSGSKRFSISFSTRAYWAGPTNGCLPRERGWCLHIAVDRIVGVPIGSIVGDISNQPAIGLAIHFNKKTGITPETFSKFFKDGKFHLDGPGTMPEELIRQLELPPAYVIPEGYYPYKEDGDMVLIVFKK